MVQRSEKWRGRGPSRMTRAIGLMLLKRALMRARILKIENKSLKAVNKAWKMYGKAMSAMMKDLGEATTSLEARGNEARASLEDRKQVAEGGEQGVEDRCTGRQ